VDAALILVGVLAEMTAAIAAAAETKRGDRLAYKNIITVLALTGLLDAVSRQVVATA
jgi:hypothetical protein